MTKHKQFKNGQLWKRKTLSGVHGPYKAFTEEFEYILILESGDSQVQILLTDGRIVRLHRDWLLFYFELVSESPNPDISRSLL